MLRYLPFLLVLALWIYAFIDCLNTPEEEVRHLPKVVWVLIVLLFGEVLIGPVAWLATGRVRRGAALGQAAPRGSAFVAPDDDPAFLQSLNTRQDAETLKDWEADLRRREEELRRREQDGRGSAGTAES